MMMIIFLEKDELMVCMGMRKQGENGKLLVAGVGGFYVVDGNLYAQGINKQSLTTGVFDAIAVIDHLCCH